MTILHRTAALEAGTGRTVHGIAVPFGETVEIIDGFGEYRERFERGAFARTIRERAGKIRLFTQHDRRRLPIGRATVLRETDRGLHVEFAIAETSDGDDALELIRSGIVDSFSIGFRPIRDRRDGDIVSRTEVALLEVSLVSEPAYPGALVGGVRSREARIPSTAAQARLRLLSL